MKISTLLIVFGVLNICTLNLYAQKTDTTATNALFALSLEDLMDIEIVSASKKNQNIIDAPSVVSVITEKQIQERGYTSIAEALNSVAGLDVITDYFQPNMGTRGINGGLRSWSRLIKVMIDGQSISFRSSSDNFLDASLIPIDVVEKIEIIRGPNSAIYGKNAFLGVVNIITKKGEDINNSISHYLGNINNNSMYNISTVWGGNYKKIDLIFSSSYSQLDYAGITPTNVPGNSKYNNGNVALKNESNPLAVYFKLKYKIDTISSITIDVNHQNLNSSAEFIDWGTLTHNNKIRLFNAYERISYSDVFFENLKTDISFTRSSGKPVKNEILDTDDDHSEWIEREVSFVGYDINLNTSYSFDDINNFTFGIDYTSDMHEHQKYYTVNDLGLKTLNGGGTDGPKNFNNFGVYMQMIFNASEFFNVNLLEKFTLTAGYRFDYHNIYGDVLNYRIALVYNIADRLSTKLMYGTSFNAPSSVQLYSNYITPGGIVGNPDLKPERAKTTEWSIIGELFENVNFSTNVFYTEIDDKIEYLLPYGDVSNIKAENVSNIYSAGLEAELNASFSNNTSYLNYSYQRSILEKNDPLLDLIRVKTALYPDHTVKFGHVLTIPKAYLKLNLEGKYISSRIASDQNNFIYDPIEYEINRYELDSYLLLNLMISTTDIEILKNSKTRFSFKIQNVLDTQFNYPGFKDYDIPGLGRTYFFKFIQII